MAIGPERSFPFGRRINSADKGGLYAGFRPSMFAGQRVFEVDFGTVLNWIAMAKDDAADISRLFRLQVTKHCGQLPYNAKGFPFTVVANHKDQLVETTFTRATTSLVANPEFWLGWAEQMERCVKELDKGEAFQPPP